MAGNVRSRVLSVLQILTRNTDEDRTLTTPEIIDLLGNRGISADRRSIYEDIESINDAGWEVLRSETGKRGYYYASREFEDAEIGLMLDSLFAFSFLTDKKLGQGHGIRNHTLLCKESPVRRLQGASRRYRADQPSGQKVV